MTITMKHYGHAAFGFTFNNKYILVDPFIIGNPICPIDSLDDIPKTDLICLTHGHEDHVGDTIAIAKRDNCPVLSIYEIAAYLESQDVENALKMNIGGRWKSEFGLDIIMVRADHSSGIIGPNGQAIYMGSPCGLILDFDGRRVYHMGDTDIFSDMGLINELYSPHIGLVPIGDLFTMDPAKAALACNRFFDFETIIPMHYDTFDLLTGKPEPFAAAVENGKVKIMHPCEEMEI